MLTVLSIAYPFAEVGPDAVGGAEQIAWAIDRALVRAGHRSLLIACEHSRISGTLLPIAGVTGAIDEAARAASYAALRVQLERALCEQVDVIHLHGIDFANYLPDGRAPVVANLHLPPAWYPAQIFRNERLHLVCVSAAEQRTCPRSICPITVIDNGVDLQRFTLRERKRPFVLALGRVCPEKGFHHALDAAERAGLPLWLGGQVFPYEAHQRYFEQQVRPRLHGKHRFLGPLSGARKRRLLAAARCLLVPSLVDETSSLVAMEAIASGTPVVAFQSGALGEIVEHGVTGYLVAPGDTQGMAAAIRATAGLSARTCRERASARFDVERMCAQYLGLYERVARDHAQGSAA
jgi:glycosyltransferase involved in cell wall biosynthesis